MTNEPEPLKGKIIEIDQEVNLDIEKCFDKEDVASAVSYLKQLITMDAWTEGYKTDHERKIIGEVDLQDILNLVDQAFPDLIEEQQGDNVNHTKGDE